MKEYILGIITAFLLIGGIGVAMATITQDATGYTIGYHLSNSSLITMLDATRIHHNNASMTNTQAATALNEDLKRCFISYVKSANAIEARRTAQNITIPVT